MKCFARRMNTYSRIMFSFQIPIGAGEDGAGPSFLLPPQFTTDEVCRNFRDLLLHPTLAAGAEARTWLESRGFNAVVPPAMMFSLWAHDVPGANDLIENISYDSLHCFFIGLLDKFMDAVVMIISNSHEATQLGYDALGLFDSRISAFPSFDTGYRLYRSYPGGYLRRAICSGTDRLFLLLLFIPAIGFDDKVIRGANKRAIVLAAIEAACVLALLLRATALTAEGRMLLYTSARRFLELLVSEEFKERQKSG
jgi:hypothetical protein